MNTSTLLARGFGLHWPEEDREPAQRCALCGAAISTGVPLKRVIQKTTTDIADTFRYGHDHTCGDCAACFSEPKLLVGNLFASAACTCKPVVSLDSATDERPAWRDLIRTLPFGTPCVALITSNTKRRLWPAARISGFGPAWRPYFVDGDTARTLDINANRLIECMALIERVMDIGFSKRAIAESLLFGVKLKDFAASAEAILQYESVLAQWRGTDEFLLALFVAQKESN